MKENVEKSLQTRRKNQLKECKAKGLKAKQLRLEKGLTMAEVTNCLGITLQSLISKEKKEQPWQWEEVKKLITLYNIKSIKELLEIF